MSENRRRTLALALCLLLALSLVPVLLAGDCAHPYSSDYAYSRFVHRALTEGGSLWAALAETVKYYYFGWQGNYAGVLLMALQPGLISERAYILTPILLLGGLCLATAAFTHALLCRWLKQDRWTWLAATAGLLLCTIQYEHYIREGMFCWNGGVYYMGFYALMLLLFTCLIRLRLDPRRPGLLYLAALGLAVLVGGGNYVTGLLSCLALGGYTLVCLLWDRRRLWQPATVGLVLLGCFLVSALAPGNAVRQAQYEKMPAFRAVFSAVTQASEDIHAYIHLPFLALMIGLAPVLWRALGNTTFRFPLPGLVTAAGFLAVACQSTPAFYALGTAGPGRMRNIIYSSYLILLLLTEGYWLGWLRRKRGKGFLSPGTGRWLVKTALFVAVAGFLLSSPRTPAYQCTEMLLDGSARAFDEHMNGWEEALSDPETEEVVVPPLPVRPPLLYSYTLTDNPDSFGNTSAAEYYGKSSVIALPAEEGS